MGGVDKSEAVEGGVTRATAGLNSGRDSRMSRKSVEEWGWGNSCSGVLAKKRDQDSLTVGASETCDIGGASKVICDAAACIYFLDSS